MLRLGKLAAQAPAVPLKKGALLLPTREDHEDNPFYTKAEKGEPPLAHDLADKVLWEENDEWPGFIRPSMIGGCKRASYYHLTKAPIERQKHEPKMARVLKTGTVYHKLIQEILGNSLLIYFAPESPVWDADLEIRGKCDGILITRDLKYKWMLELKTASAEQFKAITKPKEDHVWQAHTYAKLHNCRWIDIVYICKANQTWKGWRIEFQPQIWKEIEEWTQLVKSYRDRGRPPRFDAKECDPSFCTYVNRCFAMKAKEEAARGGVQTQAQPVKQSRPTIRLKVG